MDDTAENALAQISQEGDAFPFSRATKTIQKVGVLFLTKDRNVGNWLAKPT